MDTFNDIHRLAQAPLEVGQRDKIICLDWRPCDRHTLKGFAKIEVPSWHIILDGVAIHEREGRSWAQLPARPQIDKDGQALRDDSGKIKYAKIIEFTSKNTSWAFSDHVVAAVKKFAQ